MVLMQVTFAVAVLAFIATIVRVYSFYYAVDYEYYFGICANALDYVTMFLLILNFRKLWLTLRNRHAQNVDAVFDESVTSPARLLSLRLDMANNTSYLNRPNEILMNPAELPRLSSFSNESSEEPLDLTATEEAKDQDPPRDLNCEEESETSDDKPPVTQVVVEVQIHQEDSTDE